MTKSASKKELIIIFRFFDIEYFITQLYSFLSNITLKKSKIQVSNPTIKILLMEKKNEIIICVLIIIMEDIIMQGKIFQ